MKTLSAFSFKTAISAGLALTLLGTVAGCAVVDPGYGNYPIYGGNSDYGNADYKRVSQTLSNNLRRQGYQVMDIRSDNYRGNHAITAIARKNNQTYELKYSYPDLRLISSNKEVPLMFGKMIETIKTVTTKMIIKKTSIKIMANIKTISAIKTMISKTVSNEILVTQRLSSGLSIK